MDVHQDFEDMLRCLNAAKARYLLVGAYAVAFYTEPRYTKDLDIWVDPSLANAKKVYKALQHFGAPLQNLGLNSLTNPKLVYQIGVEPVRIDIIMGIAGIRFADAWKHREAALFGKENVYMIGFDELLKAKKAANRGQDKLDISKMIKRMSILKK